MADLLHITQSKETDKTTWSLLLFVTVMDYVFRQSGGKTENELEGSKSLFAPSENNSVIVCAKECLSQNVSTFIAIVALMMVCF